MANIEVQDPSAVGVAISKAALGMFTLAQKYGHLVPEQDRASFRAELYDIHVTLIEHVDTLFAAAEEDTPAVDNPFEPL